VKVFVAGRTFADYDADEQLRSAVERKFEIMGEALTGSDATIRNCSNAFVTIATSFRSATFWFMATTLLMPASSGELWKKTWII
jgi:hypothetical protein